MRKREPSVGESLGTKRNDVRKGVLKRIREEGKVVDGRGGGGSGIR